VGALLAAIESHCPNASLAGVDINRSALEIARRRHPSISFFHADICDLPFADEVFDAVACVEVIEHVEAARRADAFREMRRVTKRGGRLVVSTPHAGWFSWLDANNLRFRVPALHRKLLGRGIKDEPYQQANLPIVPHAHFRVQELVDLAGSNWKPIALQRGGLLLTPVIDWMRWPFYRRGRGSHPLSLLLERVAAWDLAHDYRAASWRLMLVFDAI
jgi:SAM-dependent methyltransferase